jgi:hypothetical protein
LYCIILLSCYAQYLYLETLVLTSVYLFCIVFVSFVCVLFFLTSFMSDCLYNRICVPTKLYDMYVCMYVEVRLLDVKDHAFIMLAAVNPCHSHKPGWQIW